MSIGRPPPALDIAISGEAETYVPPLPSHDLGERAWWGGGPGGEERAATAARTGRRGVDQWNGVVGRRRRRRGWRRGRVREVGIRKEAGGVGMDRRRDPRWLLWCGSSRCIE